MAGTKSLHQISIIHCYLYSIPCLFVVFTCSQIKHLNHAYVQNDA
jgi:hypothetical protein